MIKLKPESKKFGYFSVFFSRKVFSIWNFYANQLVFRVKQPYILSFVEIPVGVVTHLGDFTEIFTISNK